MTVRLWGADLLFESPPGVCASLQGERRPQVTCTAGVTDSSLLVVGGVDG